MKYGTRTSISLYDVRTCNLILCIRLLKYKLIDSMVPTESFHDNLTKYNLWTETTETG